MKREVFEKRYPQKILSRYSISSPNACYSISSETSSFDMGLAPGGKMHQEIYDDPFDFNDWDQNTNSRCFVHIANSLVWRAITDENPPTVPFTAKEYTNYGFPWFEYYDDNTTSIDGSSILSKMKSIIQKGNDDGRNPLPENDTVEPENIKKIVIKNQVREGIF